MVFMNFPMWGVQQERAPDPGCASSNRRAYTRYDGDEEETAYSYPASRRSESSDDDDTASDDSSIKPALSDASESFATFDRYASIDAAPEPREIRETRESPEEELRESPDIPGIPDVHDISASFQSFYSSISKYLGGAGENDSQPDLPFSSHREVPDKDNETVFSDTSTIVSKYDHYFEKLPRNEVTDYQDTVPGPKKRLKLSFKKRPPPRDDGSIADIFKVMDGFLVDRGEDDSRVTLEDTIYHEAPKSKASKKKVSISLDEDASRVTLEDTVYHEAPKSKASKVPKSSPLRKKGTVGTLTTFFEQALGSARSAAPKDKVQVPKTSKKNRDSAALLDSDTTSQAESEEISEFLNQFDEYSFSSTIKTADPYTSCPKKDRSLLDTSDAQSSMVLPGSYGINGVNCTKMFMGDMMANALEVKDQTVACGVTAVKTGGMSLMPDNMMASVLEAKDQTVACGVTAIQTGGRSLMPNNLEVQSVNPLPHLDCGQSNTSAPSNEITDSKPGELNSVENGANGESMVFPQPAKQLNIKNGPADTAQSTHKAPEQQETESTSESLTVREHMKSIQKIMAGSDENSKRRHKANLQKKKEHYLNQVRKTDAKTQSTNGIEDAQASKKASQSEKANLEVDEGPMKVNQSGSSKDESGSKKSKRSDTKESDSGSPMHSKADIEDEGRTPESKAEDGREAEGGDRDDDLDKVSVSAMSADSYSTWRTQKSQESKEVGTSSKGSTVASKKSTQSKSSNKEGTVEKEVSVPVQPKKRGFRSFVRGLTKKRGRKLPKIVEESDEVES